MSDLLGKIFEVFLGHVVLLNHTQKARDETHLQKKNGGAVAVHRYKKSLGTTTNKEPRIRRKLL